MKKTLRLMPLAALLMLAAPGAQAKIYKCVAHGKTSYQAAPCSIDTNGAIDAADATRAPGSQGSSPRSAHHDLPWTGLKSGMSVMQVRQTVMGAQPWNGPALRDGGNALLYKRGVMLADMALKAQYYFIDGKLLSVVLMEDKADEQLRAKPTVQAKVDVERLRQALEGRFGKPATNFDALKAWHLPGGATISLSLINVDDRHAVASVAYRPPL